VLWPIPSACLLPSACRLAPPKVSTETECREAAKAEEGATVSMPTLAEQAEVATSGTAMEDRSRPSRGEQGGEQGREQGGEQGGETALAVMTGRHGVAGGVAGGVAA